MCQPVDTGQTPLKTPQNTIGSVAVVLTLRRPVKQLDAWMLCCWLHPILAGSINVVLLRSLGTRKHHSTWIVTGNDVFAVENGPF